MKSEHTGDHDTAFNKTLKGDRVWQHEKRVYPPSSDYEPFTPESTYYDDIAQVVQKQIDEHNRLVLVLQGLLDRSPVFHPHAPVSAWTAEGFQAAFKLVYDDSRALNPAVLPNFEEYRDGLNAQLRDGSVTVGQEDFWEHKEAATESLRLDNDWRTKTHYRPEKFRPYGNPGPGVIATVVKYAPRSRKCVFRWERERQGCDWYHEKSKTIPCSLTVPAANLLNISAYKPGDYKQFFNDPRTRADYLKWAPLLLRAEEYHAGNTNGKRKKS